MSEIILLLASSCNALEINTVPDVFIGVPDTELTGRFHAKAIDPHHKKATVIKSNKYHLLQSARLKEETRERRESDIEKI